MPCVAAAISRTDPTARQRRVGDARSTREQNTTCPVASYLAFYISGIIPPARALYEGVFSENGDNIVGDHLANTLRDRTYSAINTIEIPFLPRPTRASDFPRNRMPVQRETGENRATEIELSGLFVRPDSYAGFSGAVIERSA